MGLVRVARNAPGRGAPRLYGSRIIRVGAILGLLAAAFAGNAHAQALRVVVVPGLQAHDLRTLAPRGAVGLLVPGAGPQTSARAATVMLAQGVVRNSLRGAPPARPVRILVEQSQSIPTGGRFIVVGLPQGGAQPNNRRYGIAVVAPGYRGLLTSPSTRIPGLVTVADVAPTALAESGALGSQGEGDPIGALETLDRRITDGNAWRTRTATWVEIAIGVLAVVSGTVAVVGVAGVLLANLLAGALGIGTGGGAALLLAGAACGLAFVRRRPSRGVLAALMAGVLAAYLLSFELDERWVALSPLGPSQNARFYGVSNLLETFLLVPALVGAALLRRRPWAAAGVALLAFVMIAGSRFGADGGGAIVLGVGYAVLVALLTGAGRRTLVAAVAVGIAVVLGPARARRGDGRIEPRHAGAAQRPGRARVGSLGPHQPVVGPPDGEHRHDRRHGGGACDPGCPRRTRVAAAPACRAAAGVRGGDRRVDGRERLPEGGRGRRCGALRGGGGVRPRAAQRGGAPVDHPVTRASAGVSGSRRRRSELPGPSPCQRGLSQVPA